MSNIVKPEQFVDKSKQRSNNDDLLRTLLIISIIAGTASLVLTEIGGYGWTLSVPIIVLLFATIVSLAFEMRGMSLPGRIILPTSLFIVVTAVVAIGYGLHDIDLIAYSVVIVVASLTLGPNAAIVFAFLIIMSISAIGIAEIRGIIVSPTSSLTNGSTSLNFSTIILALAFIQRALVNRLNHSINSARESEQKQILANRSLQEERSNLEQRIQERTKELERRAVQLRAAAEVGSATASMHNLDTLLNQTIRLINLRFGFYHTGIFLLDDTGTYVVLRAALSEGGQKMLARGHKLGVGQKGIVGNVAKTGQARIALDVGQDAIFFDNPDLPETHSEMALPLIVGNKVIGVLDVQSNIEAAFAEEDVTTLQIVADQLSIAIENSRLLAESQIAAESARRAYGELAVQSWKDRFKSHPSHGYRSSGQGGAVQIDENVEWTQEAIQSALGEKVIASNDRVTLHVPILVRGQTIGVIKLQKPNQTQWTEIETQAAQSLAEQLSGALDSARLYEDSQKQAIKEKIISEATARVGSALNIENILQATADELNRALGNSEIILQLTPDRND